MSCSQTTQVELSLVKTLLDANNNGDCSLSRQLFRFDFWQVDTKIGVEKKRADLGRGPSRRRRAALECKFIEKNRSYC
jgi:hypothetical protein